LLPLFDGIVEAPLIDQLHDKIKLPMVAPERENFYNVRMIYRSGDTRFLLQLRGVTGFSVPPQKFQRDEAIQRGVACFINGTHSTDTERFDENEIIKRALDAKLFATLWTWNPRKRFGVARVDLCPAGRTRLHLCVGFVLGHQPILTSAFAGAMSLS
jgi:hypothetical protein